MKKQITTFLVVGSLLVYSIGVTIANTKLKAIADKAIEQADLRSQLLKEAVKQTDEAITAAELYKATAEIYRHIIEQNQHKIGEAL